MRALGHDKIVQMVSKKPTCKQAGKAPERRPALFAIAAGEGEQPYTFVSAAGSVQMAQDLISRSNFPLIDL
jgi:hypothetical protein